jgi:SRSO17 transposase
MTLARHAQTTVTFVDDYCAQYQDLFPDVRSFEQFTFLHVGMLSEIKRKSLPAIAKAVGKTDGQALHHFLAYAPWSVAEVRARRLSLVKQALRGRPFTLCIDETGDEKKGHTTDYAAHQYIGNLGKLANGVVSVNAYGLLDNITFPLLFSIFKPETRLHPEDTYQTKPALAVEIIEDLQRQGFQFSLVLADSLYGESSNFIAALERLHLNYIVGLRFNHGVWLPPGERIRYTRWRPFARIFTNGSQQPRYIREVIYGHRRRIRFYEITVDPVNLPTDGTWFIMTNLPGDIRTSVGNLYGLRTWVEYGFKQAKDELGWADYRVTDYHAIERWWEIVCSPYLLVSLQSPVLLPPVTGDAALPPPASPVRRFAAHRWWDTGNGWKNVLNNLRLILQPYVLHCLILPWLLVFDIPALQLGFKQLTSIMNTFHTLIPT